MFCKWCGANISGSATVCDRCGRETPAMSDCGGFYDLVPKAKEMSNPVGPRKEPTLENLLINQERIYLKHVEQDRLVQKPVKKSKIAAVQLILMCACFAVVIALLLGTNRKLCDMQAKLDTVNARMESILAELEQMQENKQPEEENGATSGNENNGATSDEENDGTTSDDENAGESSDEKDEETNSGEENNENTSGEENTTTNPDEGNDQE